MARVRDVLPLTKLQAQILESHVAKGAAAQVAIDELLEECRCGHVRAAHVKPGQCCEVTCDCRVFRKAVR
jgi:hypothetical protein